MSYKIKLTPYAQLFYREWQIEPCSAKYNVVIDQEISGSLCINRLQSAIKRLCGEHIIYSSCIKVSSEVPYWVKCQAIPDLTTLTSTCSDHDILQLIKQPFNLENEAPVRFILAENEQGSYRFIIVLHHLVTDGCGISKGIFELLSHYYNDSHFIAQTALNEQIKKMQKLEYSISENLKINASEYKTFWMKRLSDCSAADLRFLYTYKTPEVDDDINTIKSLHMALSEVVCNNIQVASKKLNLTHYQITLGVFAILLNKYTSQERFLVSFPVAIREGIDYIYGGQVNTCFVPFHFSSELELGTFFENIKLFFSSLREPDKKYFHMPTKNLVKHISKDNFDVCFIQTNFRYERFKFANTNSWANSSDFFTDSVGSKTFLFEQEIKKNKLYFRVRFDKKTFDVDLVKNFIQDYESLLQIIVKDLINAAYSNKVESYKRLTQQLQSEIFHCLNETYSPKVMTTSLVDWFRAIASKWPDNIALVHKGEKMSYRELDELSNKFANYLSQKYFIERGDFVAIYLNKSMLLIVYMLGILKSGAAYVPIDTKSPEERVKYILKDTKSKLLITKSRLRFYCDDVDTLIVDEQNSFNTIFDSFNDTPPENISPDNVAYVIYTSGTTGLPKGVVQTHKSLVSLFIATEMRFNFNEKDVWLLLHSYAFDFSVWELWGALLYGGKLVIPEESLTAVPVYIYKICQENKITVLNQTPMFFYQLISYLCLSPDCKLTSLRYVIFGGDILNHENLHNWFSIYGHQPKMINMYGTTETAVHSTFKEIKQKDFSKISNIGKMLPDQFALILNKEGLQVPIGGVGELCIGGARLANHYINKPVETERKFIKVPVLHLSSEIKQEEQRLYKTGDIVRLLPSGEMQYLGRRDKQISINGFRVELKEIENSLLKIPGITQAKVLAIQDSDEHHLIAYYVGDNHTNNEMIRGYLIERLPYYMIPEQIILLDKLPLNCNGKVDDKKLAFIKKQARTGKLPVDTNEEIICGLFSEILNINPVYVQDDFFALGGNSMLAVKLTAKLQSFFYIKVSDIFKLRTPSRIAKTVNRVAEDALIKNLLKIKEAYKKLEKSKFTSKCASHKFSVIEGLEKAYKVNNILLTGSTGFLGIHILQELLQTTNYNIYVLLRAKTMQDAEKKLNDKFLHYFKMEVSSFIGNRVFIILGDIEKHNLGLSEEHYAILYNKIDNIVHSAAMVKHYGNYESFYAINVMGTKNILALTKYNKHIVIHYISTISVLLFDKNRKQVYTEASKVHDQILDNAYLQTKICAELEVEKARAFGVQCNIYRMGNLALSLDSLMMQKNVQDNAFINMINFIASSQMIATDLNIAEITPVDYAAKAVVKLFDKQKLLCKNYHIMNVNTLKIHTLGNAKQSNTVKLVSMDTFINFIISRLKKRCDEDVLRFILYMGWLDGNSVYAHYSEYISSCYTQNILKQLGFKWPSVSAAVLSKLVSYDESMSNEGEIYEQLDS